MSQRIIFQYRDLALFSNNFSPENYLGGGGFAEVYKGKIPQDNGYPLESMVIAIKKAKLLTVVPTDPLRKREEQEKDIAEQTKQFDAEENWLPRLNHQNIMKMLGYCSGDTRCIVLQHVDGHTLKQCIKDLDWKDTVHIMFKLAKTLEYLHSQPGNLVHGDIKPDNILITKDKEPILSDFGSLTSEDDNRMEPRACTTGYYDTENRKKPINERVSQGNDVYAFAVVLLQMITKIERPHVGIDHIALWAENTYRRGGSLVDKMLVDTGCSNDAREKISTLCLQLTDTNVFHAEDVWGDAFKNIGNDDFKVSTPRSSFSDTSPEAPSYVTRPTIAEVLPALEELYNLPI